MYHINQMNNLKEGQTAQVTEILTTGSMRRRLQDIGLIKGTKVECLQKNPSGDPIAYSIRGAIIALRSEDSGKILVQLQS